jgi:hypothetical protein
MPKESFTKKISGPVATAVFYLLVSKFCFILLLTVVTSLVLMQGQEQGQANQMINDIAYQYMFIVYAVGAIFTLFVSLIADQAFSRDQEFWRQGWRLWQLPMEARREFWRGAGTGLFIPVVVIVLLQLSGQLNYLGTFVTSDTRSPIFFLFLANAFALAAMLLCEEFIFRHKILGALKAKISPLPSVVLCSVGYVIVKHFQFSLALFDYVSLFLVSLSAGFFFLRTGRIFRGMGFLGTLFGVIHFVCGLNLWGHNTPGLFLFTDSKSAIPTITGGIDGPLAGLAMISVLAIITASSYLTWARSEATLSTKR